MKNEGYDIPVGDEDLERADDLRQWDGLVGFPLLCSLCIFNEDDEVLVLALVVDLGLNGFATSHDCWFLFGSVGECCVELGLD